MNYRFACAGFFVVVEIILRYFRFYAAEIVLGLLHLHQRGIIYRYIKTYVFAITAASEAAVIVVLSMFLDNLKLRRKRVTAWTECQHNNKCLMSYKLQ